MEPFFSAERTRLHAADTTKSVLYCLRPHTTGHDRIRAGARPSLDNAIAMLAARPKLQSLRKPRSSAENGLAANDDELVPVGQVGGGTDDVLELVTPPGWCCADAP